MAPASDKKCPLCNGAMVLRKGPWSSFYGCVRFPICKGKLNIDEKRIGNDSPMADDQKDKASAGLTATINFVRDVGGLGNAWKWLRAYAQITTAIDKKSADHVEIEKPGSVDEQTGVVPY